MKNKLATSIYILMGFYIIYCIYGIIEFSTYVGLSKSISTLGINLIIGAVLILLLSIKKFHLGTNLAIAVYFIIEGFFTGIYAQYNVVQVLISSIGQLENSFFSGLYNLITSALYLLLIILPIVQYIKLKRINKK